MGIDELNEAKQALEDLKAADPTLSDEAKDEQIIEDDTRVNTPVMMAQIDAVLRMYCSDSQQCQKAHDEIQRILGW
jgi:hypothetical protein